MLRVASLYLPADLLDHLRPHLEALGALAGGTLDDWAGQADRNPPVLHPRTRTGADRQWIEKHPAYTEMERLAFSRFGMAALSHRGGVLGWPAPMPPAAKYLLTYLFVQAEFGLMCPLSMTDSLTRTLRRFGDPALVARYLPALTSQDMDVLHQGAMFMTEQGAGSDVGATSVRAEPGADGMWRLTGDKWFCSNADADLAMGTGAAGRCAGWAGGSRAVPAAAHAAGWTAQSLPDRAAEIEAGHAVDGERGDPPGRCDGLAGRRSRRRVPADGGHGKQLPPIERRAGGRADAPRGDGGAVRGGPPRRVRTPPGRHAADCSGS